MVWGGAIVAAVLVVSPMATSSKAQGKRAFETSDWYKVKTVGAPAMSPDGSMVAVQVTTPIEKDNKRLNEIWVVSTSGGDPVRFSAPGADSTNPRFSADGKQLIYSGTRPGQTGNQWEIRMDKPGGEMPYTAAAAAPGDAPAPADEGAPGGSEEHTSELQSH